MQATKPVAVSAANPETLHNEVVWQKIAAYRHEDVCRRFSQEYNKSAEDAEQVFLEVKRFLYLITISQQTLSPSKALDLMWHAFVLHTASYREFCQEFYGRFIDHNPTNRPEVENYIRTRNLALGIFGALDENLWPNITDAQFARLAADCNGPCCVGGCVLTAEFALQ